MTDTPRRFRVALTGDFFAADGSTKYPDIGLSVFEGQAHIEWVKFREHKTPRSGPTRSTARTGSSC